MAEAVERLVTSKDHKALEDMIKNIIDSTRTSTIFGEDIKGPNIHWFQGHTSITLAILDDGVHDNMLDFDFYTDRVHVTQRMDGDAREYNVIDPYPQKIMKIIESARMHTFYDLIGVDVLSPEDKKSLIYKVEKAIALTSPKVYLTVGEGRDLYCGFGTINLTVDDNNLNGSRLSFEIGPNDIIAHQTLKGVVYPTLKLWRDAEMVIQCVNAHFHEEAIQRVGDIYYGQV